MGNFCDRNYDAYCSCVDLGVFKTYLTCAFTRAFNRGTVTSKNLPIFISNLENIYNV